MTNSPSAVLIMVGLFLAPKPRVIYPPSPENAFIPRPIAPPRLVDVLGCNVVGNVMSATDIVSRYSSACSVWVYAIAITFAVGKAIARGECGNRSSYNTDENGPKMPYHH